MKSNSGISILFLNTMLKFETKQNKATSQSITKQLSEH